MFPFDFVLYSDSVELSELRALSFLLAVLQILIICLSKESLLSIVTPNFFGSCCVLV